MMYRAAWRHEQSLPPVPSLWNSVRGASLRKCRTGSPRLSRTSQRKTASACSEDGNSVHVHIDQVSGIEFTVLDDREYSYCLVESWRKDINYGMTALEISSQKIEIFNQFRCFTGFPMGNDPVFISRCDSWSTFSCCFPMASRLKGQSMGGLMGMYRPSVLSAAAACFCPGSMLFPSQAVCRRVRAVSTAGVCRRHDRCRAPAHLPGSPVCRCR